jgi:putative endonuclease
VSFASIKRSLSRLSWRPRPPDDRLLLARRGERAAARHLKRCRHKILARNYRCAGGEIDLISADGDTLVFVEVRTRSSTDDQDPQEAIRPGKWRHVERTARYFLMQHAPADTPCRFDFVAVVLPPRGSPVVEHFEDAYQPRSRSTTR